MDDPKQILGDAPQKTSLLTGSLELFDINILPERYRRKKFRLVAVLPWLLLILFLAALYPSVLIAREAQSTFMRTQIEVTNLQTSLESYQSAAVELAALQEEINLQVQQKEQIQSSYQGLDLKGSNWSPTLFRVVQNAPDGISLTSVTQQDQEILLEGIAAAYPRVLEYLDSLSSLEEFSTVQIETIEQIIVDPLSLVPADPAGENLPTAAPPASYTFSLLASLDKEGQQ